MARLEIDIGSVPGVTLDVIAPEPAIGQNYAGENSFYSRKYSALWLLHGLGGISSDWLRYTMIELFAKEKDIFVIAPTGENGFFKDCDFGDAWEKRLTYDLWDYLHNLFPMMSSDPSDNLVVGADMGGYGAIRFGLNHPDKWSFAASLSGMLDYPKRYAGGEDLTGDMVHVFDQPDKVEGSDSDLWTLASSRVDNKDKVSFYVFAGTNDDYYSAGKAYFNHLQKLGFKADWAEENGKGNWRVWNRILEEIINTQL